MPHQRHWFVPFLYFHIFVYHQNSIKPAGGLVDSEGAKVGLRERGAC